MDVKLTPPQVMNTKNLKKLLSFTFEYFSQDKVSSQGMYLKNNPYTQASKQYVYVKKDSELNTVESNLYLANDGQSLRFNTVFGATKSSDTLPFFQKVSANNYKYNYESSSVVNEDKSTSENTTFGIESQRSSTEIIATTTSTILESNPYDGAAYSFESTQYLNYKFLVKSSFPN